MLFDLLLAQAEAAPEGAQGPPFQILLLQIGFFVLIFYFLLIRPQQKRQKEHQKLVNAVKKGDRVITAGGLHGLVTQVKEKSIMIKIADGVRVELEKSSIGSVVPTDSAGDDKSDEADENEAKTESKAS